MNKYIKDIERYEKLNGIFLFGIACGCLGFILGFMAFFRY
jgi:hypothetical protein